MDPVVVIVVAVVVAVLVLVGLLALLRSRRAATERREHLQDRFGPEYDRAVSDADDTRQAEARLAETERRREELDIRPLTPASRDRRVQQWESVQTMFVDAPVEAVDSADRLVADVMAERGYPTGDVEDKLSMLAADHAGTVEHYRTAENHRDRFRSGEGSTEDLRRAFVEYRRLFDVLVDDGVSREDAPAGQHAARPEGADAPRPATTEPATTEPATTEPATTEPATTETERPEPSEATRRPEHARRDDTSVDLREQATTRPDEVR